jgi:hypothetical protein
MGGGEGSYDGQSWWDYVASLQAAEAAQQAAPAPEPTPQPAPAAPPANTPNTYQSLNDLITAQGPTVHSGGGYNVDATGGEGGGGPSYYVDPYSYEENVIYQGNKGYIRDPDGSIREFYVNEPERAFNEEAQASGYYTNVYNPDGSVSQKFNRQRGLWEELKPLATTVVGLGGLGLGLGALTGVGAAGAGAGAGAIGSAAELAALGELGINTALTPGTIGGIYGGAAGAADLAALGELGINTSLAPGTAGGIYGPAGSTISGTGGIASLSDAAPDIGSDWFGNEYADLGDIGLDTAELADIPQNVGDIGLDMAELADIPTDYYDPGNINVDMSELNFENLPTESAPSTPSAPKLPPGSKELSAAALRGLGELGINTDQLDMSDFNNWEYEEPPLDLSTPDGSTSTTKPPSDSKPPSDTKPPSTSTESNWMKDLLKLAIAGGLGVAASKGSGRGELKPVGGKGPSPGARRWDPKTQTYYSTATGERIYKAAGGGISGLPRNEYKAGGRYLRGPGDGMSDNIKANIDGVQEARLADGEFVIPADVVSHIGNGSSNAGAKKLHDMMNRIRHARTGNPRQGRQIKAEKYLPV